jgi:hypothetical protein
MYSDETYGLIIWNILEHAIPTGSYDQTTMARGVSLLKSISAVYLTETERARATSRTKTDARLKSIRQHVAKAIEGLDANTAEPPSNASDTVREADLVKSQLLAKLAAVHNLWRSETETFAKDFYEFSSEIVHALKKAEEFFSYLDQLQATFDGMDEAQRSASYFPLETDTRKMRNYRLAYRGVYPYLRKHSSETPVHLTIPLIVELYELLYGKSFGIAPNYKPSTITHDERHFISRWNSPGLRFFYRVIRELGMLETFIKTKKKFGPCNGQQFRPNASYSCTDDDCLPCRHAEAVCLDVIGNYWNNSRGKRS